MLPGSGYDLCTMIDGLVLTRDQARSLDRLATEKYLIPSLLLMENAGINATAAILDLIENDCQVEPELSRVVVLCGGGNNGGDGYVIARHLHNWGAIVTVVATTDPADLTGDAQVNHQICTAMGVMILPALNGSQLDDVAGDWADAHVIVDAMLGTGFSGKAVVRPGVSEVIHRVNAMRDPFVVAIDVPSGLDCDTGVPSNATIQADMTITFVGSKRGFDHEEADPFLGRLVVADIGVPPEAIEQVMGA